MALGDTYKVTMVFQGVATLPNMTTGFHIQEQGLVAPQITDVGEACIAWWDTELEGSGFTDGEKGLYDDTVSLVQVDLRRIDPLEPIVFSYTTGLPIAGTGASQTLPRENAVLTSLRTGNIGRSYRGRLYLPPIAENAVDENLTLAVAESNSEQFVGLCHLMSGFSHPVVVWSKTLGQATEVTRVQTDINLRSQRRRNQRVPTYGSENV